MPGGHKKVAAMQLEKERELREWGQHDRMGAQEKQVSRIPSPECLG